MTSKKVSNEPTCPSGNSRIRVVMKWVSVATTTSGCRLSIWAQKLVPERPVPTMKKIPFIILFPAQIVAVRGSDICKGRLESLDMGRLEDLPPLL